MTKVPPGRLLQSPLRRRTMQAGAALVAARLLPAEAAMDDLPGVRELTEYLAGRTPQFGRLSLDIPRLADNGNAVPLHIAMQGPFAAGAELRTVRLYSEKNPVPLMARFDFAVPPAKAELDTRVRLAGTQRIVAVAELANGDLHAAFADVAVTVSACLDGT
jgi:sulfur-oxidizing protein SoxY